MRRSRVGSHLPLLLRVTQLIRVPLSTAKINEDNFGPEDDEIQFDDCGYGDDDDVDEVSSFDLSCFPLMSERQEAGGTLGG